LEQGCKPATDSPRKQKSGNIPNDTAQSLPVQCDGVPIECRGCRAADMNQIKPNFVQKRSRPSLYGPYWREVDAHVSLSPHLRGNATSSAHFSQPRDFLRDMTRRPKTDILSSWSLQNQLVVYRIGRLRPRKLYFDRVARTVLTLECRKISDDTRLERSHYDR